jgi:hypothetical protein
MWSVAYNVDDPTKQQRGEVGIGRGMRAGHSNSTNPGTRADPQQLVEQVYSHAYRTRFKSGRLRGISFDQQSWCVVKCRVDPGGLLELRHRSSSIVASSMDSILEAFRYNPADDSFAALAAQPTALPNIRCNGSSRTKLHYCSDAELGF